MQEVLRYNMLEQIVRLERFKINEKNSYCCLVGMHATATIFN